MLFIKNGHIKTMAGNDIENGCILVGDDGKILATFRTGGFGFAAVDGENLLLYNFNANKHGRAMEKHNR